MVRQIHALPRLRLVEKCDSQLESHVSLMISIRQQLALSFCLLQRSARNLRLEIGMSAAIWPPSSQSFRQTLTRFPSVLLWHNGPQSGITRTERVLKHQLLWRSWPHSALGAGSAVRLV